jgi:hypothetical protein
MKTSDIQIVIAVALVGALACTSAHAQSAESTCKLNSLPDESLLTGAAEGYARMAGKLAMPAEVER